MLPEVVHADSFDWMRDTAERFDAIVTDPPYGLSFMGKAWDNFGTPLGYQQWSQAWAELALSVVKPGAHMVAFGAPRLYHRMAVGIEDAGWEVRDCLMWMFGSGFPKSLNLAGDRENRGVEQRRCPCGYSARVAYEPSEGGSTRCPDCKRKPPPNPSNGYGTALKPAYEPIILARAPLSGTVQETFDEHGTGALHIDAARIPLNGESWLAPQHGSGSNEVYGDYGGSAHGKLVPPHDAGRWPANLALDETAAAMLDAEFEAVGGSPRTPTGIKADSVSAYGNGLNSFNSETAGAAQDVRCAAERGATGPSRFFYTSKASRAEREAGLTGDLVRRSDGRTKDIENPRLRTNARRNHHPSVKPIDLMRWLCRLIVPSGGRILDPFAGSGSTLIAAHLEDMTAIGIEREAEYVDIARGRIAHHCAQQILL